jgi:hypothetical protein
MSTHSHTILVTLMAICLAAALAVATTHREHSVGLAPAAYGLGSGVTSR